MANILVIGFPAEGHTNPSLGVIEELISRGESVVYYGIEEYQTKIQKTGATFRNYYNFIENLDIAKRMSEEEPDDQDTLEFLCSFLEGYQVIIEEIMSEVANESYDYVLYDHHLFAGSIIADLLNLPKVSLCTTFAMNDQLATEMMPSRNIEPEQSPYYPLYQKLVKTFNEKYDVNIKSVLDVMSNPGDITLVFTSPYFQPHREMFDNEYKFNGPSIVKRKDIEDLSELESGEDKVVYFSMGTIFNQKLEIYDLCFEALKDFKGTVILSAGKQTDLTQFKNIPDNFIVKNYVPQLEVLKKADLFVTHGGMNSTSEGLYYDTPLVVIPMAVDQYMVADRVTELGAGKKLDKNDLTSQLLNETIQEVLSNPQYKKNAEKIGHSLRTAGGYKQAADEIYKFVSSSTKTLLK
ncbi:MULTISPECIES: macrolide family glycosyltransferase [Bacillus]|uniref:Glycosyl transferase family 1 n=2 Tax=Bacillus TaxID=1386 RepID=A0A0M4FNL4_9BACI|nr:MULTISPECIES: macrolide family glycosyltransferase [Bacillus]ALC80209.1 glycosyl transferase family 1 [Bacillus gobiensis]MBP1082806.1 MGT family glycosyltransferase [Bacillus capparidis]MED1098449.1 glycosyltransferase [Bacillus capparidis]